MKYELYGPSILPILGYKPHLTDQLFSQFYLFIIIFFIGLEQKNSTFIKMFTKISVTSYLKAQAVYRQLLHRNVDLFKAKM